MSILGFLYSPWLWFTKGSPNPNWHITCLHPWTLFQCTPKRSNSEIQKVRSSPIPVILNAPNIGSPKLTHPIYHYEIKVSGDGIGDSYWDDTPLENRWMMKMLRKDPMRKIHTNLSRNYLGKEYTQKKKRIEHIIYSIP